MMNNNARYPPMVVLLSPFHPLPGVIENSPTLLQAEGLMLIREP